MTVFNNLGFNSGGWIDRVLDSKPKSIADYVFIDSWPDSLFDPELTFYLFDFTAAFRC